MHELSIADSLVKLAQKHLPEPRRGCVRAVGVRIGELSDVFPDALKFGYQIACQGTELAGSQLEIEPVPISARCNTCGLQNEIERHLFICSGCGSSDIEVTSGLELDLAWIKVDDGVDTLRGPQNTAPVREGSP